VLGNHREHWGTLVRFKGKSGWSWGGGEVIRTVLKKHLIQGKKKPGLEGVGKKNRCRRTKDETEGTRFLL